MPYIFCLLVDLASVACCAWLGWLVYQGAAVWLVLVMMALVVLTVYPGLHIFTCPKCGWIGEVKVYKVMGNTIVQKDKNDPDD